MSGRPKARITLLYLCDLGCLSGQPWLATLNMIDAEAEPRGSCFLVVSVVSVVALIRLRGVLLCPYKLSAPFCLLAYL